MSTHDESISEPFEISPADAAGLNAFCGSVLRPILFAHVGTGLKALAELTDEINEIADVSRVTVNNHVNALKMVGLLNGRELGVGHALSCGREGHTRTQVVYCDQPEQYMPVAGVLLKWTLKNEYPTRFLGKTVNEQQSVRTPVATAQLIAGLLRSSNLEECSVPEFEASKSSGEKNRVPNLLNERAKALQKLGLLDRIEGGRYFHILNPTYEGEQRLSLPTKAAYRVLETAWREYGADKEWTPQLLADLAVSRGIVKPRDTKTLQRMKYVLSDAAAPGRLTMEGALERSELRPNQYTFTEKFRPKAESLIERLGSLQDPAARADAAADADEIAFDSRLVNTLLSINAR